MRYKISQQASEDLEDIWLYTYKMWSLEQADRYVNLLFDEMEYLAENPDAGKALGQLRKGYRCSKVKSHLIFYRISTEHQAVEIIRILHERMNIEERWDD